MGWQRKILFFKCDNSSLVSALKNKSSKNGHLMKLLRRLVHFAVKFNFDYSAIHVEGKLSYLFKNLLSSPYIFSRCILWHLAYQKQLTCHTQMASDILLVFAYNSAC